MAAEGDDQLERLGPDDVVAGLLPDSSAVPPDTVVVVGFLGRSALEGHWRLYLSPELDGFVELPESHLLHRAALSSPLGGSAVWVRQLGGLSGGGAAAARAGGVPGRRRYA